MISNTLKSTTRLRCNDHQTFRHGFTLILRQVDPFLHRTHETEMVPWPVDFCLQVLVGIQDLFSLSALGEFRDDIFLKGILEEGIKGTLQTLQIEF